MVRELGKSLDPFVRRTLDLAHEHLVGYDEHLATREHGVGVNIVTEMRGSVRSTIGRIARLLGYPPYDAPSGTDGGRG